MSMLRDNVPMSGWLAVLVDNREYVRFCPLREGESGLINLTTMLPDQDRAYIEVYFVNGNLHEQIHTFHASEIRTGERKPQIVVSAHVRGDAAVTLRIDGELVATERFAIPLAMRRARPGPWIAAAAGLILLAALGWGIWWVAGGADAAGRADSQLAADRRAPDRPAADSRDAEPATRADSPQGAALSEEAPSEQPAADRPPVLPATTADGRTLYFTPESARLILETRAKLDATTAAIAAWADAGGDPADLAVAAVGHTALYDTEASRLELSRERARAAAAYLEARLGEAGVRGVEIETTGRGGREPVTRETDAQWRNRRVEISVELAAQR